MTTTEAPTTSITVHLAEKTMRKALNRLKKLEPAVLFKKIETTQERAAQLTIKLVRARKELQDLETAKHHLENPPTSDAEPKKRKAASDAEPKPKKRKTAAKPEAEAKAEPKADD